MTTMLMPYCRVCKHFDPQEYGYFSCRAFPLGIPEAITAHEVVHDHPMNGDNGLVFEPKDPGAQEYFEHMKGMIMKAREAELQALMEDEQEGNEQIDEDMLERDRRRSPP